MDEQMVRIGEAIRQSVDVLESAANETQALFLRTYEKLKDSLEYNELVKIDGLQEHGEYFTNTKSDWLCFQYMKTFNLIEPGARTSSYGYLSLLVDFKPDDDVFPDVNIPLFHVIYSPVELGSYDDCSLYKWVWGSDDSNQYSVAFNKLQLYASEDAVEDELWNYGWSFSMPLTVLRNVEDVERLIVNPVTQLLNSTPDNPFINAQEIIDMQVDNSDFRPLMAN